MAVLFSIGLLAYYAVFLRARSANSSELARLLWLIYFGLGCSAILTALTGALEPTFEPNYPAILFLLACISISISGFLGFRSHAVRDVVATIRGQALIEAILIALQGFAIIFFLPFALDSLTGDVNMNRLELSSKIQLLGSYGLINTVAGMGSHLFPVSLVMAGIRLCQPEGAGYSLPRIVVLVLCSLSYVVYVLAYVGRDGSIYWLMTALLVFLLFRTHMPARLRRQIVIVGTSLGALTLLPIVTITVARFTNSDFGVGGSLLEYYGAQIHHFSDYASMDRPMTYGAMNFPLAWPVYCSLVGDVGCTEWDDIKSYVFDVYLAQGKVPWVFGTYVSDFIADFGYVGTVILVIILALVSRWACVGRDSQGSMSVARLLFIILLFLTPYWGVFYFRFGAINSFLVANLAFIAFVWGVQHYYFKPGLGRSTAGVRPARIRGEVSVRGPDQALGRPGSTSGHEND